MTLRFTALSMLITLFLGCASTPQQPLRVDGSTPEAFRSSYSRLNASLSASQQAQLNTAILLLGVTKLNDPAYQGQSSFGPETLRTELDGKTFDQILAAAKATGTTFKVNSH